MRSVRFTMGQRLALVIFSLGLIFAVFQVNVQTRTAERTFQTRALASSEVILDSLSSLCRAHLVTGDIDGLTKELAPLADLNRLAYIDLFSMSDRPLLQLTNPNHGRGSQRDNDIRTVQDHVLDLQRVVEGDKKPLGRLEIGIWVEGVQYDAGQIGRRALGGSLLTCFLLGLGSWLVGYGLSRRLEKFSNAVKTTPIDDYSHLPVTGNDEITDLTHAFNERLDRLKQADLARTQAERERQQMTQMIVHDLKGPLSGLSNGLAMLEESVEASGDPSLVDLLRVMRRGNGRLLRMIDSILQVARLGDPTIEIERELIDLREIASRRVEELSLAAKTRNVDVALHEGDSVWVIGDPELLGRVVDNLLFNALEHSPRGGVISVSATTKGRHAVLQIHDQGPGIPVEDRERIFELFQKGQNVSRGVGLGLAFCKRAMDRHGGEIRVDNSSKSGAIFSIRMDLAPRGISGAARQLSGRKFGF